MSRFYGSLCRSLRPVYPFLCTADPFTQPPESYALLCFSIGQTP